MKSQREIRRNQSQMLKQSKAVHTMMERKLMKEPGKLKLVTERNHNSVNVIKC